MAILNPKTLEEQFRRSHTAMRTYWQPFFEYERIARNRPHPKVVAAKLPTVTDGTLSGIIIAQPKRVVQRIPTGGITSVEQPDLAEIADFIWENEIIPNANTNGDMLLKSWIMISKALTYGMQFSYQFFKSYGDGFAADFKIPYIKDLIMEEGKSYGPDCNVLWLRQWYTPGDIKQIIQRETKLSNRSKKRGDTDQYESPWDIGKLKELLELAKPKDADALTPAESEKSPAAKFIPLIHAFEKGVGATFYTFSPDLDDGQNIIRTRKNRNPMGKMPISFLYADIDLSNPLGRGHVELSGAMQNMIDSEVQSYQLMQKLMLNPPVMKWGDNIRGSTIKYKPNAVWDMGSDPNSKLEPVNIQNEALANFANNYNLMKSQILSLTHNNESTVSSDSGNAQSKTPAGVKQQASVIGFDDNYMRRQFGYWFEDNAENMLNIHFAESDGKQEIELTEDFLEEQMPQMEQTPKQVQINQSKKQAVIDYGQIKNNKFKFKVDPTSSEDPDDEAQVANLKELLADTSSNPYIYYYMLNDGYQLKLGEAYKDLFKRLGVEGIDKIVVKLPEDSQDTQEQLRGTMNPLYDKPTVSVPYIALPPAGQIQAAANAGITLTMQDVLGGPVVDPNVKDSGQNVGDTPGVQTPVPNPQLQPQQPQQAGMTAPNNAPPSPAGPQGGPPPAATQPTDSVVGDPGQPSQPNGIHPATVPPPTMNLKRNDVGGLQPDDNTKVSDASQQAPQGGVPVKLTPQDEVLAKEFLTAGYSPQQVVDAMVLIHHGRNHDEVLQAIGPPAGGHPGGAQ